MLKSTFTPALLELLAHLQCIMEDWLTRVVLTGSYTYERERTEEGGRKREGKAKRIKMGIQLAKREVKIRPFAIYTDIQQSAVAQ